MLLVSSRLGQFTATPGAEGRAGPSRLKSPLSRSYGRILPSSFTTIISIASVFSTYPPVSVWGTGGTTTRSRSFSRQHRITRTRTLLTGPLSSSLRRTTSGFAYQSPYRLDSLTMTAVELPSCVPPQLVYYRLGSQTRRHRHPKAPETSRVLSITRFDRTVAGPVREYQPVNHRLRLSASP